MKASATDPPKKVSLEGVDEASADAFRAILRMMELMQKNLALAINANEPVSPLFVDASSLLVNGWVNFGGAFRGAGYYKDQHNLVRVTGLIANGTIGLTAFQLPIGFRPTANLHFAVASNAAYGQAKVDSSGNIVPLVGSNVYFSLSGIIFQAS